MSETETLKNEIDILKNNIKLTNKNSKNININKNKYVSFDDSINEKIINKLKFTNEHFDNEFKSV